MVDGCVVLPGTDDGCVVPGVVDGWVVPGTVLPGVVDCCVLEFGNVDDGWFGVTGDVEGVVVDGCADVSCCVVDDELLGSVTVPGGIVGFEDGVVVWLNATDDAINPNAIKLNFKVFIINLF